jgi:hypothetical protein
MRFSLAQGVSKTLQTISAVLLPKHTRRLVLWSTLYNSMCGGKMFTPEQTERLNAALSLCKDSNALTLPAILGKFIWPDLDGCTLAARQAILGEQPATVAGKEFVHSIPTWLRYASDATVLKDFESLLATHRRVIPTLSPA